MATARTKPEVDYKALTECSSDVVMQVGPDNDLIYVSPSARPVLGWSAEELYLHFTELLHEDDRDRILGKAEALQSGRTERSMSAFRVYRKDGSILWVEGAAHRLVDAQGNPNGIVINMRDISQRMKLKEDLEALARTDGLTGLANRRSFDEMLEKEWAIARREKSHLSLLVIDLDYFKSVNDSYGHQVGDECLRAVGDILRSTARRPADLVARYGGEELAVILPRTHEDGAQTLAEYIRLALQDLKIPNEMNEAHGRVLTLSVGVATALCLNSATHSTKESLISCADQALYKAKMGGRNRVEFSRLIIRETDP
ncbi:GGDEF domain-containing protein [Roseibium aestuarii]|uniref:diguanylate cyclase n=2 Tax=Roseibium aestuarii TaxID=2600299 RepID=A0ABW4JTM3_9HYPH|nr:sensor domain-containing diguanylate cyclase [Roseibium aestuarii]